MQPQAQSQETYRLCQLAPVIPVIVIGDAARAEGLARALVAGGLPVLEVTLRTEGALEAISRMARIEGGYVGAGTVLTPDDARRAKDAGARFAVAPGLTETLAQACTEIELPLLPGAVTASEIMRAAEMGYDMLKFFPAETSGGAGALKALSGPLPKMRFCPTGGVTPQNAPGYLSLPNVVCVGGSWLAPESALASEDWAGIEERARAASALRG